MFSNFLKQQAGGNSAFALVTPTVFNKCALCVCVCVKCIIYIRLENIK